MNFWTTKGIGWRLIDGWCALCAIFSSMYLTPSDNKYFLVYLLFVIIAAIAAYKISSSVTRALERSSRVWYMRVVMMIGLVIIYPIIGFSILIVSDYELHPAKYQNKLSDLQLDNSNTNMTLVCDVTREIRSMETGQIIQRQPKIDLININLASRTLIYDGSNESFGILNASEDMFIYSEENTPIKDGAILVSMNTNINRKNGRYYSEVRFIDASSKISAGRVTITGICNKDGKSYF